MMGSRIKLSALGVTMLLLLIAPASNAAISCSVVIKDLRPCVNYLTKGSGKPPSACCAGASALASATSSSADKKAACECIKSASKNIKPNNQLAQALPSNWLVESLEAETGSAWMGMKDVRRGVVELMEVDSLYLDKKSKDIEYGGSGGGDRLRARWQNVGYNIGELTLLSLFGINVVNPL
ncbi:hypothetical protein Gotri_008591 [Gossypium trilobum]|uniref:Bifunctional inhibitor/plant lipid transfer protein/seed storage helical domain-containing protein n=1 Tax=Gossypium trilobum TaxID=34281 RepID=A0A7J9ELD5_9ROSI|nr:hypothetical protein [Gossypium trilobum]